MGAVKKDDQSIEEIFKEIFKLDAESYDFKIFVTLFIKLIAESSKDSEISLESLAWSCNGKISDFKVFVKLVDIPSVPKKMTRLYNVISSKILNLTFSNFLQ